MFRISNTAILTNPYLSENFAPVKEEITTGILPVKGVIPEELSGRLIRIGPNPVKTPESKKYHWFMGNGMLHGITIRNGIAQSYRNRYVVDSQVAKELKKPAIGGPHRLREGTVNTNVVSIGDKIYAIVEAGSLPVEIDAELESVQRSNLNGSLKAGFTAHPRKDPTTGELHAITYEPGRNKASYIVVNAAGTARNITDIALTHSPMIHDTAITASYIVVLDLPVSFDMLMAVSGTFPYRWDNRVAPRIGLIPRNSVEKIKWFEAPSCYVFHIMNAYDDGAQVVLDVVKHPKTFDQHLDGPREGASSLVRWVVNTSTNKVTESVLDDRPIEFPRINEMYIGGQYRFGYTSAFNDGIKYGPIFKHDVTYQTTEAHNFDDNLMAGEPVFVPRQSAKSEDDGWILTCIFDKSSNKSQVHIIDALNFGDNSVAVIELPVRIPFGFHGNWFAD
jgi:carotenoid cleavage dioxygenase-like enzyme